MAGLRVEVDRPGETRCATMVSVKERVASPCAVVESPDCLSWIADEVLRRRATGDARAVKHVALDICKEVWCRTSSRRQANTEYRRALQVGREALRHRDNS
jgi:hypothetical protein